MKITRDHIVKIHALLDHGLVKGLGEPEQGKMCVEAAINYALGRPHGDDPGCVMEPLRRLKIRLNDSGRWTSNKARAEGLRRLAIAQLGSKDLVNEREFVKRVARMTIQTVVPSALRSAAKRLRGEHPTKLLALVLKCEQEPTEANVREARQAAYDAAADAYAAATDAYAAAAAAAYDDATAAAYDDAAADAYAAYAADEQVLVTFAENVVQILIEMKAPGCQWLEIACTPNTNV